MQFFANSGYSYGSSIPFQRVIEPQQLGQFLDLEQAELLRIQRYHEHWNFYLGKHWNFQREDSEPLVTHNYAKLICDKSVSWMVENGITIDIPEATRNVVKPLLDEVWKYNELQRFLYEATLTGTVTGDVFVLVTYEEPSAIAQRRNPNTQGKIRIQLLGSEQVYPVWDPLDARTLLSVRIETIYYDQRNKTGFESDNQANHAGRALHIRKFSQTITPDVIIEQYEGGEPVARPNVLGEIPLVHIANFSFPREYYGASDLDGGPIDLNRELNEKNTDASDTVNYNTAPVIVITGAKASSLERSPRQIWSGLPADAKVQQLNSPNDLGAVGAYIESTRQVLLEVSETPEILLKPVPASNSTGAGLSLLYSPIVSKIKRKLPQYVTGMQEINYLVLRIANVLGMLYLPFDLCASCGGRIVETLDTKGLQPRMVKKCYRINKDDFSFMTPAQVPVPHVRQHSFGTEMREDPLHKVEAEHKKIAPSAYDPEPSETQAKKEARERDEEVQTRNAVEPPMPPAPGEAPLPPHQPLPETKPQTPAMPTQVTLPEEPEDVLLSIIYTHPTTGATVHIDRRYVKLVPTGCDTHVYLDPYTTSVEFLDALPRDDQYDATLHALLQQMQVVSKKWIMRNTRRIKPDEYDDIERELKEEGPPPGAAPAPNTDKQGGGEPGRPAAQEAKALAPRQPGDMKPQRGAA